SGPLLAERKVLKPRRRRTFAEPRSATVLISQWSSPTESLLRTPGEQLLKRVPRLDESLISIKPTITNQQDWSGGNYESLLRYRYSAFIFRHRRIAATTAAARSFRGPVVSS